METPSWPEDVVEMPHYSVRNDHVCVGSQITNAFVNKTPLSSMGEKKGGCGGQLFLVLDGRRLFGLVANQAGSMLLFEPLLTSPLVKQGDDLMGLGGGKISLDELVII